MDPATLVFIESVDANSVAGDSPLEHLAASGSIAAERGFPALSVARCAGGEVLTPSGFMDEAFDVHLPTGVAVAARTIESSMWGLPAGSDYVAVHWIGAKIQDPQNFLRIEDHRWPMLYVSEPGDVSAQGARPQAVFARVLDVRISPDGGDVVWLESIRDGYQEACLVWTEELGRGARRLSARFNSATCFFGDMSLSLDGRWLLADAETKLIDLETGRHTSLGPAVSAACWYPMAGASFVLLAERTAADTPARVFLRDLSSGAEETVGTSPLPVHGLQAAPDGRVAARINDLAEAQAGGWFDHLVVTDDFFRTIDSVAAVETASGWRRRATRPRWTAPWHASLMKPVVIADELEANLDKSPSARGLTSEMQERAAEAILPRIRHRLARMEEEPDLAVIITDEIRALTEWVVAVDAGWAASVSADVVPLLREALARVGAAADSSAAGQVDAIATLASGARLPAPALVY